MARLIAKSATEGLLPLTVGSLTLSDATPARITAVAPYPGRETAADAVLGALGLGWPAANRAVTSAKAAILWSGRSQAFLLDDPPKGLAEAAALTDLSDGWVALALEGPPAVEALARLVPLDLSAAAFPQGATARSALGHMMLLLHRAGPQRFHVFVFRSMVRTAVHELEVAMKSVAARASV